MPIRPVPLPPLPPSRGTAAGDGSPHTVSISVLLAGLAAACLLVALPAFAQSPPGSAGATPINPETGELPTLVALFMFSPIINGIIAALSVLALMMFTFFVLSVSPSTMAPPTLVDDVTKLVLNGKHDEAAHILRNHRHVFAASIMLRCVENASKPHSVIMGMIDSEGRRRADVVWNRTSYLADIANIAPMLGLLGTVIGMIKAFFLLPTQYGNITSELLSRGIGEAMTTTMFGLIVAIIATVFYSIVKSRVTRTLADVEQVVHSVADHIKRETGEGKTGEGKTGEGVPA